jgi:NitT/TauT family transport system substrate-binding protein
MKQMLIKNSKGCGQRQLFRPVWCALMLFFVFGQQAHAAEPSFQKASFIPQWVPQAQFAGYYVAKEKGFYRDRGIDLTIIDGGPTAPADQMLIDGAADFATLWLSTAIAMRDQGIPIVNIAQMMQRSALMLVAFKSSHISSPVDMAGKKIGMWGPIFQVQPKALFAKYGIEVEPVRQSYSVNLFLRGGVDVAPAMWYNEYHTIINAGINEDELNTFFFYDHGLNFPEDGIYVLEETYDKNPALCGEFVAASVRGWEYAFAHPEEALDIIMAQLKKVYVPATRVHQRWMLNRMRDLMIPKDQPQQPMGHLDDADYQRVGTALLKYQMISELPAFSEFHEEVIVHEK